jgi:hypothetical protein
MVNKFYQHHSAIVQFVQKNFSPERVICLMTYGSSLSEQLIPPEDYDFLLLLKTYDAGDYDLISEVTKSNLKIDFFLDYEDQIIQKGFENYQRGRHGVYFFAALSTAQCLIGKNFYLENISKIPEKNIKHDLLFRIEEYFYRIQKNYIWQNQKSDSSALLKKYISRICMDLLLYNGEMTFSEVHTIHYVSVVNVLVPSSNLFSSHLKEQIRIFFLRGDEKQVPVIVGELYKVYLSLFKNFKM